MKLGFEKQVGWVDFLGSITGKTSSLTGAILTTHRYKPYGARLSGPFFGSGFFWTGNTGSRSTGRPFAEQYNRARHYSTLLSQWTTRDALWPMELAYGYVWGNPTTWTDPKGSSTIIIGGVANAARIAALAAILGISIPLLLLILAAGGSIEARRMVCRQLAREKDHICGNKGIRGDVKGECDGDDPCMTLFYKMDAWKRCAAIRQLVTLACYDAFDPVHLKKVLEAMDHEKRCQAIAFLKGCFDPDPCRVPDPQDIPVIPAPIPAAGTIDPTTGYYH